MKRILFILFSLVLVSSCFDDGSGMGQSYTASADFNYMDIAFFPDSTFFNTKTPEGFGYDALREKVAEFRQEKKVKINCKGVGKRSE